MSKKTIIILGEGNYIKDKNNYIQATGEFDEDNGFKFVSIQNGQYCIGLNEIELLIKNSSIPVAVYVFIDFGQNSRFKKKLVRNLNQRKPHLREELEKINAYFVDLKKGRTDPFIKKDKRDKKKITKRRSVV